MLKKIVIGSLLLVIGGLFVVFQMMKEDKNPVSVSNDTFFVILTEPEKTWIENHPLLTLGVMTNILPYQDFDRKRQETKGISAGYQKIVADSLGIRFRFVPISHWDEGVQLLKEKKIDALSFIAQYRAKQHNLVISHPYLSSSLGIFSLEQEAFVNNLGDIPAETIITKKLIMDHPLIKQDNRHHYRAFDNNRQALQTLKQKEARYYLGDILLTKYTLEKYNYEKVKYIAPVVGSAYDFVWAVEPENIYFVLILNKIFAKISTQQDLKLRATWGTEKVSGANDRWLSYAPYWGSTVLLVVLMLLTLVLYQQQQRKKEKTDSQLQKMESLGRLAGGVAHDFNNMLAAIQGSAEFLRMNLTENNLKKVGKYVDVIIKSCQRGAYLTSQLLIFSRKKDPLFEPININKLIQDSLLLLEHSIFQKIKILVRLKAQNSCVRANRDLIQNLLLNLGFNARDAMPHGGRLLVATRNVVLNDEDIKKCYLKVTSGNYLEIAVRDSGGGIASGDLAKIFEPFFTTKKLGKGTGLGLSEAYGIIGEHKGTMAIKTSSRGTLFKIYLPLSYETSCREENVALPTMLNARVLVVEDDKILSELLRDILKALKCDVVAFNNPIEALAFYKTDQNFDFVMLDVLMPEMSGAELYEKMKLVYPPLHVAFMSGYSQDTKVEQLVRNNDYAIFVKKPYNLAELSKKLQELL